MSCQLQEVNTSLNTSLFCYLLQCEGYPVETFYFFFKPQKLSCKGRVMPERLIINLEVTTLGQRVHSRGSRLSRRCFGDTKQRWKFAANLGEVSGQQELPRKSCSTEEGLCEEDGGTAGGCVKSTGCINPAKDLVRAYGTE